MYTKQYVATFVQGASGERLELLEAVEYVDVLVLRFGRHVAQLNEVAVADAEREDVDGVAEAQAAGNRARVAAVRVAVGDEEHRLARVRASRPQHFLRYDTIRDAVTFNVRSKADTSRLNLPSHGNDNYKL